MMGHDLKSIAAGLSSAQAAALSNPDAASGDPALSLTLGVEGWRGPLLERKWLTGQRPTYQRTVLGDAVESLLADIPA